MDQYTNSNKACFTSIVVRHALKPHFASFNKIERMYQNEEVKRGRIVRPDATE
jgi:hypothetical protein